MNLKKIYIVVGVFILTYQSFGQYAGGFGRGDTSIMITNSYLSCDYIIDNVQSICSGDTLFVGSNMYTQPDYYIDTLHSIGGCDSIIHTTLTVNQPAPTPSMHLSFDTLFSSSLFGNQWYDTLGPIPGANNNFFIPQVSGYYWVQVIDSSGCISDVPEPVYFFATNILEESVQNKLIIFPNPCSNQFTLFFDNKYKSKFILNIYDLTGRNRYTIDEIISGKEIFLNNNLSSGIYFIEILGEKNYNSKLIIE